MGKEVITVFKYIDCVDAGSEYCPCSLAERGECIICSQLKDQCFCDCLNWKGTCIYNEFIWNNHKGKKSREYQVYKILNKKYLRNDLMYLDIKVDMELARELNNIGAFVFLKNPKDIEAYSTPISILNCNIKDNIITVAIKIDGVKTKALKECEDMIAVKGPYWNGIQGLNNLKELKNKSCLILARGCAAAPSVLAAKKLVGNGNQIVAVLDKGRSCENFAKPYFKELGCITEDIWFTDRSGKLLQDSKNLIEKLIKKWNFKVVLSGGSDNFHYEAINFIHGIDKDIKFASVNNSTMCCGEGVCGSCQIESKRLKKIKTCKQQYNPIEIFLKEMER
jgi:dihydroorotate dehydrogenase electron transfer subunit